MAIVKQPASLSLLDNMAPFEITGGAPVTFKLLDGDTMLVDEVYEPLADGKVIIDVRDLIRHRFSFQIKTSTLYAQSGIARTFTAIVDGTTISFKVVRGGVSNLADTPSNWLRNNFLTWQPTTKQLSYQSPEWLTYYAVQSSTLQLKAYFDDGTTQSLNLGSMSAGSAYTANLQYAHIAGLLGNKYPQYYDVWTADSFVQRYVYTLPKTELEQWILFENSLGGLDTLRAGGSTDFTGEHIYNHSVIDGQASEFRIDTMRNYTQHTGPLDDYERRWLLDLFPSPQKYIHHAGAIRPIVFTADISQYSTEDLPSNFAFTFRFADDSQGLLNLVRNEANLPAVITIPNLSSPDFLLPPRLSEFPRVELSEGVILPAFDPHSNVPTVTTVGQLIATAVLEALSQIPGGDGTPGAGGQLVNIIKRDALSPGTDDDVFSSSRTKKEIDTAIQQFADNIDDYLEGLDTKFLRKDIPDLTMHLLKLMAGAEFGEFFPGLRGAAIDQRGNMELESLVARGAVEFPELVFNKLTVVGDKIVLGENGTIESVEHIDGRVYQLNMRLQEGELIGFQDHDLLEGIFHHDNGFGTSYMIVSEVGQTFIKINLADDVAVPTGTNYPPRALMKIAHVGNAVVRERQRYVIASSQSGGFEAYDGRSTFLNGTLAWELSMEQKFQHLYDTLPLRPGLPYGYMKGLVVEDIIRVDYKGVVIREPVDTGPWQSGRGYNNNDIDGVEDSWHIGCKWRCFTDGTMAEPSWKTSDWIMIEGRSDARMELFGSHHGALPQRFTNFVVEPVVWIGNANVSSDIVPEQWIWTRSSFDKTDDDNWNADHKNNGRIITLSYEDVGTHWGVHPVVFTCTAIYPASSINPISKTLEFPKDENIRT